MRVHCKKFQKYNSNTFSFTYMMFIRSFFLQQRCWKVSSESRSVSLRSMNTTGTFSRARIMLPQTRKNRREDGKFTGSATAVHKKAFINLKILS